MKVKIVAVATGEEITAQIRPARLEDISLWQQWKDQMPATAEDAHWHWDEYISMAEIYPQQLACFTLLADGRVQGLILLELKHENERGEQDIHALRISTAPWNRLPNKQFKYAGSLLLATAVKFSFERGCEGRLWLESLPGAEGFYLHLGMIKLSERSPEEELVQFKFDTKEAVSFLHNMKEGFLE